MAELRQQSQEAQEAQARTPSQHMNQCAHETRPQQPQHKTTTHLDASKEVRQKMTLKEYLAATHDLIFSQLAVETDEKLLPERAIPEKYQAYNLFPTNLRPWTDFVEQQQSALNTLYNEFPATQCMFPTRDSLAAVEQKIAERGSIADEDIFHEFLLASIQHPVQQVFNRLRAFDTVKEAFGVKHRIHCTRTPDPIDDSIRVMRARFLCITEYIAPYKLIPSHLRAGLYPTDNIKDVLHQQTIPINASPQVRFRYRAQRLVAAAIAQVYRYMIEGGLEYGVLSTGETMVFLKVDWTKPETLLYHLTEPKFEVKKHPEDYSAWTAAGQYLSFILLVLKSQKARLHARSQDERMRVIKNLKRWEKDFETTLRSIPKDERRPPPNSSSLYTPVTNESVKCSPCGSQMDTQSWKRRRDEEDSSAPEANTLHMLSISVPRAAQSIDSQSPRRSQGDVAPNLPTNAVQYQQYCTHKCLLSLSRNGLLHEGCPNFSIHQRDTPGLMDHPISHAAFLQLISRQLRDSLDRSIIPLDKGGSTSMLFKVTCLDYGYTFVAKGTSEHLIELSNEADVYNRLKSVQGKLTPVFLGAVDLGQWDRAYYHSRDEAITFLLLLSHGDPIEKGSVTPHEVKQVLREIHECRVLHNDVGPWNVLRNAETGQLMIIDFENSEILPENLPLQAVDPDGPDLDENSRLDTGVQGDQTLYERIFQGDLVSADVTFPDDESDEESDGESDKERY
ncbi:hypothetical protein F5Y18DRAFT_441774 [Xylariaceae sp. FL1019]|nr:hypothetical protein F5Y18DRAFT_441774 [Xylariaceae sp. FL1019]